MTRRRTCALLVDYFGGDYQIGLIRGAEEAAIRTDNHLVTAVGRWLDAPKVVDAVQNHVFQQIRYPGTDAVALAAGCLSHYVTGERLIEFCRSFAPLPVVSISVDLPGIPSIVVDNRNGQRQIVDHLIEVHGCRRIAYIRGPATSIEASERFDGYLDSLAQHGLTYDPTLMKVGNFWLDAGERSVNELLDDHAEFDTIVAANDYMALGALDALKKRGVRVPEAMRIAGFDDIPNARMASPSLTTVRQPLQQMGATALQLLNQVLDGVSVAKRQSMDVELVRRQSCGCGYMVGAVGIAQVREGTEPLTPDAFLGLRTKLERVLSDSVCVPSAAWPGIIDALLTALHRELTGKQGEFLGVLAVELERSKLRVEILDQFTNLVECLRSELRGSSNELCPLEDICHSAVLLIGEWINRAQMRAMFDRERSDDHLRANIEHLSTALTHATLSAALSTMIPATGIRSVCLGLLDPRQPGRLNAFVVTGDGLDKLSGCSFSPFELAPEGFFPEDRRASYVLMPLTHGEALFGQALLETGGQRSVYSTIREQIGASLKVVELHRKVVEEIARRERAERERLERETEIAQQIQTAILPGSFDVPRLTIAAAMRPAASVGGDYYDVIPIEGGCFIGIGDVTGHGLLAGMIMMMMQSMITAGVRTNPRVVPSELLPLLNRALYDNVRHRLHGSDYATLTLIKYREDGRLLMAGAHEPTLVLRKKSGRCERLEPPGLWLGVLPEIEAQQPDLELQLEPGDRLILYTDGITEALNERHEQFGLARLVDTLESRAEQEPPALVEAVLQAVAEWQSGQIDDVTLFVARFEGK